MTTITDQESSFEFDVQYRDGGWVELPGVVNIIPSMDMDRVPYCDVTIEIEGIDYATVLKLDPRLNLNYTSIPANVIRFRINEFDGAGAFRCNLVRNTPFPSAQRAVLVIRSVEYDHLTRSATLRAGGLETILDDRRRISVTSIDTGASTVINLVYWSLIDTFGGYSISSDEIVSATSIPAGDRRLFMPGESHSDLLDTELQAIGCRLFTYWGDSWYANERENTPLLGYSFGYERTLQLATYSQREGAPPNADPIVYEVTESFDRSGEYADGVLVKFDTLESGGAVAYQRSGDGSNSRGRVINWKRTEPAANAANEAVKRTKIRGRDIDIVARARLDVSPGQVATVFLRDDIALTATIRSVRWDIKRAEMTIRAQAGLPEE